MRSTLLPQIQRKQNQLSKTKYRARWEWRQICQFTASNLRVSFDQSHIYVKYEQHSYLCIIVHIWAAFISVSIAQAQAAYRLIAHFSTHLILLITWVQTLSTSLLMDRIGQSMFAVRYMCLQSCLPNHHTDAKRVINKYWHYFIGCLSSY